MSSRQSRHLNKVINFPNISVELERGTRLSILRSVINYDDPGRALRIVPKYLALLGRRAVPAALLDRGQGDEEK